MSSNIAIFIKIDCISTIFYIIIIIVIIIIIIVIIITIIIIIKRGDFPTVWKQGIAALAYKKGSNEDL